MHMKEYRMRNERSDQPALIPFLDSMEARLGKQYGDIPADAGYESKENYTYLESKMMECCIKPQNYERPKTKKYKTSMAYDAGRGEYTCQQGRKPRRVHEGTR